MRENAGRIMALVAVFIVTASCLAFAFPSSAETESEGTGIYGDDGYSTAGTSYWELTLDPNGGTSPSWASDTYKIKKGNTVQLPAASYTKSDGYLVGWQDASNPEKTWKPGEDYTPEGNTTLKAVWQSGNGTHLTDEGLESLDYGETFKVSLYDEDGWEDKYMADVFPVKTQDFVTLRSWGDVEDGKIFLAEGIAPRESGVYYVEVSISQFVGSKSAWFVISVMSDMDRPTTITYDLNGGTGSSIPAETIPAGTATILRGPTVASMSGYNLDGWTGVDGGGNSSVYALESLYTAHAGVPTQDFQAHWLAQTKAIVFVAGGAEGLDSFSITAEAVQTDSIYYMPSSVQAGYESPGNVLGGWYLSGSPNTIFAPGYGYKIPESQQTIYAYAYWIDEDAADAVTVTFNANGGDDIQLKAVVESGMSVAMPGHGFTRDGHKLIGWSDTSGEDATVNHNVDVSVKVSSDKMFYAVWEVGSSEEESREFEISFNADGGVPTPSTVMAPSGSTITAVTEPTKSGYMFAGWYPQGDDAQPWVFGVGGKQITKDMVLVAHWVPFFETEDYGNGTIKLTLSDEAVGTGVNTITWGDGSDPEDTTAKTLTHTYTKTAYYTITAEAGGHETSMQIHVVVDQTPEGDTSDEELKAVITKTPLEDGNFALSAKDSTGYRSVKWTINGTDFDEVSITTTDDWKDGHYEVKLWVYDSEGNESEHAETTFDLDRGGGGGGNGEDDGGGSDWLLYAVVIIIVVIALIMLARNFL